MRRDVIRRIVPPKLSKRQKAGMLPGTVVVQGARLSPVAGKRIAAVLVNRPVRAAFQCVIPQANALQPRLHGGGVGGFGIVRGAGQRHLAFAQVEVVRRPGNHGRQGLQGFRGRARVGHALRVAPRMQDFSRGIRNHGGNAVAAFNEVGANDFDGQGLGGDGHGVEFRVNEKAVAAPCK